MENGESAKFELKVYKRYTAHSQRREKNTKNADFSGCG